MTTLSRRAPPPMPRTDYLLLNPGQSPNSKSGSEPDSVNPVAARSLCDHAPTVQAGHTGCCHACHPARQQPQRVLWSTQRLPAVLVAPQRAGQEVRMYGARLLPHAEPCPPAPHPVIRRGLQVPDARARATLRPILQSPPRPYWNTLGRQVPFFDCRIGALRACLLPVYRDEPCEGGPSATAACI